MEIILIICSVLGGLAAVVYFWEKLIFWFSNLYKTKAKRFSQKKKKDTETVNNSTDDDFKFENNSLKNEFSNSSTTFFYNRFASAFPGVRGIEWFAGKEAIKRLKILFREPLVYETDNRKYTPIWYWRGGNMYIDRFKILDRKTVLIWLYELRVSRIAAVNQGSYYQCFVYIESNPMKPTGLYPRTAESIIDSQNQSGYVSEEYGLYKNKYKINRAEYDDGAAKIRGKIVELDSEVELRVRLITPFNLIIASKSSPINNNMFDSKLKEYMNKILKNEASLNIIADEVLKLPKNDFEYRT